MSGTESIVAVTQEPRPTPRSSMPTLSRLARRAVSVWTVPLALAIIAFAVFSPALWNGFVEWDDQLNLTENLAYRGLGTAQLRFFFTTVLMGHYIPLTWFTFGLDYLLWGMNPMGYHLTSLIIYAAGAAAFYFVALRLMERATILAGTALRVAAVASTLFFTLHPLRVESVAWATERRDVLSGFFFLLTILAYLGTCEASGKRRRWLLAGTVGLYVLALASKASVMVLPAILILLDIYPLRRSSRRSLIEKIPFAVLGLAGAAVTYYAQNANLYITPLERYPLAARIGMTFFSLWFYVEKTFLPQALSPLYELPARVRLSDWPFLFSALAVTAITAVLVTLRRRWPAGLTVWAYYAIALGPVIGIIHSGHQLTHDRYSYLPGLGLALLVGGVAGVAAREAAAGAFRPAIARAMAVAGVAWVIGLATLTFQQTQVWRDTYTLWTYALDSRPDCSICHGNLGVYLGNRGFTDLAREHLVRAIALRPDQVKAYHHLGYIYASKGEFQKAADAYEIFLKRYPIDVDALSNMGATLMNLGRHREAVDTMQRAVKLRPNHVFANTNLGYAVGESGRPAESLSHFRRAITLKSDTPQAWFGLARFAYEAGRSDEALTALGILRQLDPVLAVRLGPTLLASW